MLPSCQQEVYPTSFVIQDSTNLSLSEDWAEVLSRL